MNFSEAMDTIEHIVNKVVNSETKDLEEVLEKTVYDLESHNDDLQGTIQELEVTIDDLQCDIRSFEGELEIAYEEIYDLQRDIEDLRN